MAKTEKHTTAKSLLDMINKAQNKTEETGAKEESHYIDPVALAMQGLAKNKPEELDMSEFQKIFDRLVATKDNYVISGKAGTGKSTFLKYFLENSGKNAVVVAPTGIAAINIGGQTIHSLFGFKPEIQMPENIKLNYKKVSLFKRLEVVIIDEISMVRADLLDAIDMSLRIHRDIDYPFGGVQMIFFGDLFQLPPVVSRGEEAVFSHLYPSPFFFDSKVMKEIEFKHFELEKIYRQKDEKFIRFLNKVREGTANMIDLRTINARAFVEKFDETECITLTPTKDIATNINESKLKEIKSPEFSYVATVEGNFDVSHYPTDEILTLKVGAQVMMIKNDQDGRWVNGTMATIVRLESDIIEVKIRGDVHSVPIVAWEKIKYDLSGTGKDATIQRVPTGKFKQFPVKLAYAITIHKSQGCTFDKMILDMGRGGFAHGQTYVALSRCKTLEGIKLTKIVAPKDVIVDSRVVSFTKKNREFAKLQEEQNREKN